MISLSSFIVITQHAFFRHDKRKPILVFVDRALKGMRDPPDHDLNEGVLRKHVALLLVVRSAAGCLPPVVVISLWSNIEGDRWPSRRPETIQVCLHRKPHARHQAAQVHRALWRRGSVAARGARAAAGDAAHRRDSVIVRPRSSSPQVRRVSKCALHSTANRPIRSSNSAKAGSLFSITSLATSRHCPTKTKTSFLPPPARIGFKHSC